MKSIVDVCILNLSSWLASALHIGGTCYHVAEHLIGSSVRRQEECFAPFTGHLQ